VIDEKRPAGTVTVKLKGEGVPVFTIKKEVARDAITRMRSSMNRLKKRNGTSFASEHLPRGRIKTGKHEKAA
jgi:hypothetical protein